MEMFSSVIRLLDLSLLQIIIFVRDSQIWIESMGHAKEHFSKFKLNVIFENSTTDSILSVFCLVSNSLLLMHLMEWLKLSNFICSKSSHGVHIKVAVSLTKENFTSDGDRLIVILVGTNNNTVWNTPVPINIMNRTRVKLPSLSARYPTAGGAINIVNGNIA